MATQIDLISNALLLIGDDVLNSLTEQSYRARVAVNLYQNIVEKELSKFRWGFARTKAVVSQVVTTLPDDEYRFVWQLPSDLITLIKIRPNSYDFKVYGSQVYTNVSNLESVDYIANVDESTWPPHFAKMIEYALAKDYALPIRDSAASKQAMEIGYVDAARDARFMDSQQHPQTSLRSQPFISVRF